MRMLLVWNDGSGKARPERRTQIEARVRAAGHDLEVRTTRAPGDAARFAAAARRAGIERVLVHGGDGTVNEVANGLLECGRDPGGRGGAVRAVPALAIIAGGTANDFARGMGLPLAIDDALSVAIDGEAACIDAGRVNGRAFLNVSTGGFGASATRGAAIPLKRWLGPLAYLYRGAQRLLTFKPYRAVFRADGAEIHAGRFAFFAVGNSWRTGGGTRVTPRARVADGRLDVAIIGVSSRFDLMTLLPDLRAGSHIAAPDVRYLRARHLEIEPERTVPVNADGEAVTAPGYTYDVMEQALPLLLPRHAPFASP